MCGIFFSLAAGSPVHPQGSTEHYLRCRGPDSYETRHAVIPMHTSVDSCDSSDSQLHLTFISTVLALRGDGTCKQPLVDQESSCVLCWNGEAWKIDGQRVTDNDSTQIFQLLLDAAKPLEDTSTTVGLPGASSQNFDRVCNALSKVSGPFAFVFYDAYHSRIFYGRDRLGRRSLLHGFDGAGNIKICSICDGSCTPFKEVLSDGIYSIDLSRPRTSSITSQASLPLGDFLITKFLSCRGDTDHKDTSATAVSSSPTVRISLLSMNRDTPLDGIPPALTTASPSVEKLHAMLLSSLEIRVRNIPRPPLTHSADDTRVAILYSGGLDCSVLARLAHEVVPKGASIDLLNVAFENPRVTAAAANAPNRNRGNTEFDRTIPEIKPSAYEICPDRVTGRSSFSELCRICPGRKFRFVAINVPYTETLAHRSEIIRLMRPHDTEMDLSIACAFYFAARGEGVICPPDSGANSQEDLSYTTPARVLLSGLGADEVFGGYTRHRNAYIRKGFSGLVSELELDVLRLGKRNLGRDDRVMSHWGREARYPFLDEEFLSWALKLPVWEKVGFGQTMHGDLREGGNLDAEKKALRLLAWRLGLQNAAKEKKRAVQFGSRTAKMESGRSRGDQRLAS
ncbi:hypothetical protein KEM54_002777 [Ascosphaera aggregata]|nr:hypothetical protein KEM54_002777 [Ascosphaera aggregata]